MFFTHRLLLTLMCIAFTLPFVESADMTTRNWLYHNLTDTNKYVKYLRPVNDSHQTVEVGFRFDPFIHYLDYINQELQLRGTMDMTWYDFRLSWNPDDYNDLHYIELPLNEIWQPELILYERMSKHNDESFQTETDIVKVYHSGKVDWVTIASTRTFCSINVDKFPKDEHTCDVTFTTWLHQDHEQKLYITGNLDSCEFEHLTWRLKFTDFGGNDPIYRCDHYLKNQSYVRYIATLERLDTKFGMYTLVAPNILVSVLSVFTICFKRGDRNGPAFGMMCLLALIIQLGTLYQVLPDTAFSKVCKSIATLTIVVAVETVLSVINMGIKDDSYIVSKMTNCRCCVPKKMNSNPTNQSAQSFQNQRRRGYGAITDSENSQETNSRNDIVLETPSANPANQGTEGSRNGSNMERREGNGQEANGNNIVVVTSSAIPANQGPGGCQNGSNIPEPDMVADVIRKLSWSKIFLALVFFVTIIGINVHMLIGLSN